MHDSESESEDEGVYAGRPSSHAPEIPGTVSPAIETATSDSAAWESLMGSFQSLPDSVVPRTAWYAPAPANSGIGRIPVPIDLPVTPPNQSERKSKSERNAPVTPPQKSYEGHESDEEPMPRKGKERG